MHALQIENLEKIYKNGTHALKGLGFEVKEGEFFALLGPNGSGKSTLINIMAGVTKKTSGKVKICGLDIDLHREKTKYLLGVVPQEISYDSFFNVNEALNLQSGYFGIRNNQNYIDEILEKLSLADKKYANTRALSGGMKRRLLIAMALVHKPKVLVLDEPTAGVDIELRLSLWNYMRELNKNGTTILLTTHYLEEAETLCKRTAIINLGKLVALETTKNLIRNVGKDKRMLITLNKEFKKLPEAISKYKPMRRGDLELSLTLDPRDISKVMNIFKENDFEIVDLEVEGLSLEDAFIKLTNS
ncbi:MAG: ABC transporter ATP-binding protein [Candidatus Gracilibacteria bacterium]